jgi:aquaporin Z
MPDPATRARALSESEAEALGRDFLIRFAEDTLRQRPLWIRVIVEFIGTFMLVTVAAGAGVINAYAGGSPISRTTAVIAPGAIVMALIYALGPLSGLHINPAVTLAFTGRGVFPAAWVAPYLVAQFAGAIAAAWFLQFMFGNVSAGGNYPIDRKRLAGLRHGDRPTAILVTVILNTAIGYRSIGHNAALAVGATVALRSTCSGTSSAPSSP